MADALFRADGLTATVRAFPDNFTTGSHNSAPRTREGDRSGNRAGAPGVPLVRSGDAKEGWWNQAVGLVRAGDRPQRARAGRSSASPPRPARSTSRDVMLTDEEEGGASPRSMVRFFRGVQDTVAERCEGCTSATSSLQPLQRKALYAAEFLVVGAIVLTVLQHALGQSGASHTAQSPAPAVKGARLHRCSDMVPCPATWAADGNGGGFFCEATRGCRPASDGLFPDCAVQCFIGTDKAASAVLARGASTAAAPTASAPAAIKVKVDDSVGVPAGQALLPKTLVAPGTYDLRVAKGGRLLGCAAPIGLFPGQPKYGCSGEFATAETCDAAQDPVKNTKYVAAVHAGCETAQGRGTYGYAYDDGVGLKQCAPVTKYEWILCPDQGVSGAISWEATSSEYDPDSTKRFRVTNNCNEAIWIQQAGASEQVIPHEQAVRRIDPKASHTYAIPNKGLPSTRFLPKTGCDPEGNACNVQSMPPCPAQGCDLPVDTKFEASWGCLYATGNALKDKDECSVTGQGNPSTYQDWWDGSAVDGWTLPFSVLVDDGGHGLAPGAHGSPEICGNVICAGLDASKICPADEFLTPED